MQAPFTIYNASAGAGKTYTVVQDYLTTLLLSQYGENYQNILAITFTNKAVAEMKSRIIDTLFKISSPNPPSSVQALQDALCRATQLDPSALQRKAARILQRILHNYAGFDIITIDTFTHRLLRTFALDLGISMNFEVEMDSSLLLREAVDLVINRVGEDAKLTTVMIDFALSKVEDDKNWNIALDLYKVASLLFQENDRAALRQLKDKTIDDFLYLKKQLIGRTASLQKEVVNTATAILALLHEHQLESKDFMYERIPKYFKKLVDGNFDIDFTKAKWMQEVDTTSFHKNATPVSKKAKIDLIRPRLVRDFLKTKAQLLDLQLLQEVKKSLIPIALLQAIHSELEEIKKEKNTLLISEFNSKIYDSIQGQPTPFIYERLGERYSDFFIDEFQDTSSLQWTNLLPLLDHALSSESSTGKRGALTLVGDAKQAIYRWRGGKAEQFISLSNTANPFSIRDKCVQNLPKNYRSHRNIVEFTNALFTFLAAEFTKPEHAELYRKGNQQQPNDKTGGYVCLSFVKAKTTAEELEIYPKRVYAIIQECLQKGYLLSEICILVRKQKEGMVLADYLSDQGMQVVSSDSMLLQHASVIQFVITALSWSQQPLDQQLKIVLIHAIAERVDKARDHDFLQSMLETSYPEFIQAVHRLGYMWEPQKQLSHSIYSSVLHVIRSFGLPEKDAYLEFFKDFVFAYEQKQAATLSDFIAHWHQKKGQLSLQTAASEDAISILTIHKAKGLEFPCVIYPFAHTDRYKEVFPMLWYPLDPKEYYGFPCMRIPFSQKIAQYGPAADSLVQERRAQLELDNNNILYVACTRAVEQLYIVTKWDVTSKGIVNTNTFSGTFIRFLQHNDLWDENQLRYDFGDFARPPSARDRSKPKTSALKTQAEGAVREVYTVKNVLQFQGEFSEKKKAAVNYGNGLHHALAQIYTKTDMEIVIAQLAYQMEYIGLDQFALEKEIKAIVDHKDLTKYFSTAYTTFTEHELFERGQSHRPDRICIDAATVVTLIDYKTGKQRDAHQLQLETYAKILANMDYEVGGKLLVYTSASQVEVIAC